MDDLNNNNNNPFDEQKPETPSQPDPYNQQAPQAQQGQDPYNQMPQQNPYNQGGQSANPYNMPQNPYNQGGQAANPYNQQQQPQQGQQNPYAMPPQYAGYNQSGQNPYAAYSQPGYGNPYQPYQNQSAGMAIASLVLGIISIVMSLMVFSAPFLILVPIIGLILGIVFKSKHLPAGRGLSTAGIITSICGIILPILWLILFAALIMSHMLDEPIAEAFRQIRHTDPDLYQQYYDMFGDSFPQWFENILFVFGLK